MISKGEGEVEDRQLHDGASDKLPSSQQEELDGCLSGGQYLDVIDFDADDDADEDDDEDDNDEDEDKDDDDSTQVMAHCWARQPRARPSFPHLAGS